MSEFQHFEGRFSNGNLSTTESHKPLTDLNGENNYKNPNTVKIIPDAEAMEYVKEFQMVSLSLKPEIFGLYLGGTISAIGALVLASSGNLADAVLLTGPFIAALMGLLSIKFIADKYGFK